jgi:HSP20 family protein
MLMRTDPFRDFDRLTQQVFGTVERPAAMPMDAYRDGDQFVVHFDLPGIDIDNIDLTVERNVLTVRASRTRSRDANGKEMVVSERPYGTFSRQLFLGDTLDADRLQAHYDAGVLTLMIPVAEQAKPRRVSVTSGSSATDAREITV